MVENKKATRSTMINVAECDQPTAGYDRAELLNSLSPLHRFGKAKE